VTVYLQQPNIRNQIIAYKIPMKGMSFFYNIKSAGANGLIED